MARVLWRRGHVGTARKFAGQLFHHQVVRHIAAMQLNPIADQPTLQGAKKLVDAFEARRLRQSEDAENDGNALVREDLHGIVGRRMRNGSEEYKVRWHGYPLRHDSWRPARDLKVYGSCL